MRRYDHANALPVDWRSISADIDNQGRATQMRWRGECPHCATVVTAYLWSLSGSGKCCPGCGALLTVTGASKRLDPK